MLIYSIYISIAAILIFVLYLAVQAITRGVEAKSDNRIEEQSDDKNFEANQNITHDLEKINQLYKDGVLNDDEFKKAKEKILKK